MRERRRKIFTVILICTILGCIIIYQVVNQTANTSAHLTKKGNQDVEVWPTHRRWPTLLEEIGANCTLLFEGDKEEVSRIRALNEERKGLDDTEFYSKTNHCLWLTKKFDREYYVSEVELQFPLAFALNVYNAPQQILRFLKVIYRKHNVYCIHYDQKSDTQFKQLILQLANCLPNVVVPDVIENVIWGWHTIVDAQMNCFKKLLKVRTRYPWKYVITLCGKEIPLRTNREMVESLTMLNGTSAIQLIDPVDNFRFKFRFVVNKDNVVVRTHKKLGSVPYNLTMKKSMAYVGLTEPFINFLLHNETANTLREFMDDTLIPDEHYFATLFAIPGVPGGYDSRYAPLVPVIDDYIWMTPEEKAYNHCNGNIIHFVCIVNSSDLYQVNYRPKSNEREHFFHNKFYMEDDQTVMDCLENELIQRNIDEFEHDYT